MIQVLLIAAFVTVSPPEWVPPSFSNETGAQTLPEPWWTDGRFPELSALLQGAISSNESLGELRAKLAATEAPTLQARGPLFPQISADSNLSVAPTNSFGFQFGGALDRALEGATLPEVYYSGAATLRGAYILDYAGKNVLQYKASKHTAEASALELEGHGLELFANITEAYLDLLLAKEELSIHTHILQSHRSFLESMSLRFERGEVSAVELMRQKSQVASAAAAPPGAEARILSAQRQLGLWLGQLTPITLSPQLATLPSANPRPKLGTPADLVHHLPRLRSAALQHQAAAKQARSRGRQHFPTVQLSGQWGKQYRFMEDWNTQDFWSAGATLSIPLFSGFADQAAVSQSEAQATASGLRYERLYRQAITVVENRLSSLRALTAQLQHLQTALKHSQSAYEQSLERFQSGVGDYLSTLTTLQQYQQTRLRVLSVHRQQLSAEIQLRASIGGHWSQRLTQAPRGS